jgi:hypothetical protein
MRRAKSPAPVPRKRPAAAFHGNRMHATRKSLAKAEAIENTVYDLNAVNPNRASDEVSRTPAQSLDFIEVNGREADAALARLRLLIA